MISESQVFEGIAAIDIRLKPKEYSREVLKIICDKLGYHFGSIILVNDGGIGSLFSSYNLPESYPALVHKVDAPVLSSPSGAAIESKKIVVVNDIPAEPRLRPWYDLLNEFNIKTIVWVPLFSRGKAFGTYTLYDDRQRNVSSQEKNILSHLSALFSMAIISNDYIDEIQEKTIKLEKEISEREEIEKQLRIAVGLAETANHAKNDFLTIMSHELRTPMNAIMGFTDIMLYDEPDPEKLSILKIIKESADLLLKLINDILDFAEIESGRIDIKNIDFSMTNLLQGLNKKFIDKANGKNLIFKVIKEPAAPDRVCGDEYRIGQVITNIVDNAVKFTRAGEVMVSYSYENDMAFIRVSDTGIGIPKDKKEAIFSVFSQADMSASRRYGGIGIGLTIASRLTHVLGGKIICESTPGIGSIFIIQLPLRKIN
ncbi:MAG: GAF domain-containing sensor histidine kinase [Acidobacteria bacterium]|nr:GAF domain-containing sensor histidine kinase [Acidobacteriota bacterium]